MRIWLTKDSSGDVYLSTKKPNKEQYIWLSVEMALVNEADLPAGCNPQWKNKEPIEMEVVLPNNKVIDIENVIKEIEDDSQMLYSKRDVIELLKRFGKRK